MIKNNGDVFQERVDELLLMEQRIERRTRELTEYNEKFQQKVQGSISKIDDVAYNFISGVEHRFGRLQKLTEIAHNSTKELAENNKLIAWLIITVLVIAGGFFGVGIWRYRVLCEKINDAKTELGELELQLSFTPQIIKYGNKYYVRIVKYTNADFGEKGSKPQKKEWGHYAEIWHK